MKWRVVVRPEVEGEVARASDWYEQRKAGLGAEFVSEVVRVFDALSVNPLLGCRRVPGKEIRWRYPDRFPYRVIYQVVEHENLVVVAAVLHAARHDGHWRPRIQ